MRILCEVHFCVSQEFLSLTIKNEFRNSQIHKASKSYIVYKNEIIGEIKGSVYINHAFNLDNIARIFVKDLLEKNITKIIIKQKKFSDRFCNKNITKIIDITNAIENLDTKGWAPKNIIKNKKWCYYVI